MPKYKQKCKVRRGQALQNWKLKKRIEQEIEKQTRTEHHLAELEYREQLQICDLMNVDTIQEPILSETNIQDSIELPNLTIEETPAKPLENSNCKVIGRRIVDIDNFLKKIQEFSTHGVLNCGVQYLKISGEKRVGLFSKFSILCVLCNQKFNISNVVGDFDINTAAVGGAISTGIGYSQFHEVLSSLDVPSMSERIYQKHHNTVSENWQIALTHSMNEAAYEERRIAIEKGKIDKNGIPLIDVVVDGCWSKRSYKKNYSALSGAATIIGRETKKILFLGVKNKFCSICAIDQVKNTETRFHRCFKNFSGSSTAMESTIIVEGFKASVDMYGLIYSRLISDGDSSTYAKILEARPYPHHTVEKVECRNHLLRNFCNKMESLTTDTKYPLKFRKKITKKRVMEIRHAIRKCIKKYQDSGHNVNTSTHFLFEDIEILHLHAFGNHNRCKLHFCSKPQDDEIMPPGFFSSALWSRINFLMNNIAGHSRSLIYNVDSNIVECYHSIVAKFVGGKRINYSSRGGYQTRCTGSALNFNTKRKPISILYEKITGNSPKGEIKALDEKYQKRKKFINKYKRKTKRSYNVKEIKSKDYGEQSLKPDVSDDILDAMKKCFLENLKKNDNERSLVEKQTILQSESSEWLELRRSLLTASNFGKIIKMRPYTSCASTVKQLLYKINIEAAALQHGKQNEKKALEQLARQQNIEIRPCGLFIDPEIPYLGATPDGLTGNDTIVEVKCPLSAYKVGLNEAISKKKVNFWVIDKSGTFHINKTHNWYYQIQGQLHVTRKAKCLFGLWFTENEPLKIEIIYRDDNFFDKYMKNKLCQFYLNCILPELLDPRHSRNMEIRNPIYILQAIKNRKDRKNIKNKENIERNIRYEDDSLESLNLDLENLEEENLQLPLTISSHDQC